MIIICLSIIVVCFIFTAILIKKIFDEQDDIDHTKYNN